MVEKHDLDPETIQMCKEAIKGMSLLLCDFAEDDDLLERALRNHIDIVRRVCGAIEELQFALEPAEGRA